eukprot:TRINITY_DN3646_c0_g1_i1.p1 TRINITY_DN3646_c0_g1~~TRINITY_DN3646_c0_g1_i1.p1  ORF type:complete len:189 (-),score=32.98 TRINITY_DN3646_c0_g1_i1:54-620(-)
MSWSNKYPGSNYPVTVDSAHPQSSLWPEYLDEDRGRIFIFERNKNANIIEYHAQYADDSKNTLDPACPVKVHWTSFGWTPEIRKSELNFLQRTVAFGYNYEKVPGKEEDDPMTYSMSLVPLPSKKVSLSLNSDGSPLAVIELNKKKCRLVKLFVNSTERFGMLPSVNYVDIYGLDLEDNKVVIERISP